MALLYRVVSFGVAQGPWRAKRRQAEADAIASGLAEVDEWGQVFLDGYAAIEWRRDEDVRLSA